MCPRANSPLLCRCIIDTLGTTPRKSTTQKNQKHDDACYKLVKIYPARYSPFSPSPFFPSLHKKNPAQEEEEENDKKNMPWRGRTDPARAGYD